MSIVHSNSVDSSSSTATMTTLPSSSDLPNNTANQLYEDRTHFQAIFSNDSRFFDTSLHLFKSYCGLGYIPSNESKSRKHHVPFLTAPTHGHRHRWKARLLGSNQENDHQNGTIKALLTPILLRKSGKDSFDLLRQNNVCVSLFSSLNRSNNSESIRFEDAY